jgi:hypothetical protein
MLLALAVAFAAALATAPLALAAAPLALAALLIPTATVRFAAMLFCSNGVVSGFSGKGGRASAGATATSHTANNASICVSKMGVCRVCAAAYGLQNLAVSRNRRKT